MRNFRNYNKEEIFKTIDQISIEKNEQNQDRFNEDYFNGISSRQVNI